MTTDPASDNGLQALTTALRSAGRAILPSDFDDTVATFDTMMASIEAMTQHVRDNLADETAVVEVGADAFALAVAFLERGDLDRAEHWFRCALRYHVPTAQERLADLAELRETLDGLVYPDPLQAAASSDEAADVILRSTDSWLVVQSKCSVDPDPEVQAQQIIDEAKREAAAILGRAKMRAARTAASQPEAGEPQTFFSVDLVPSIVCTSADQDHLSFLNDLADLTRPPMRSSGTERAADGRQLWEKLMMVVLSSTSAEIVRPTWRSSSPGAVNGWTFWRGASPAMAVRVATGSHCRSTPRHPTCEVCLSELRCASDFDLLLRRRLRNLSVHGIGACGSLLADAVQSAVTLLPVSHRELVGPSNLILICDETNLRISTDAEQAGDRLLVTR